MSDTPINSVSSRSNGAVPPEVEGFQTTLGKTAHDTKATSKPEVTSEALTAGNVFDRLDEIRRPSPTSLVNEKVVDVHLPVRKPKPKEHFRVCDDPAMTVQLAVYVHKPEGSMDEETFFVLPAMEDYLRRQEELRIVQVVLCRTKAGALFLWPLPVHDGEGPPRSHVTTAREIAKRALTEWIRMKWRRADNAYFGLKAEDDWPEPVWPDQPFKELLKLGFKDKVIDSIDHPVIRELRGIKVTKLDLDRDQGSWL
jgi:hypothetical protein